ncbi:hypothetical protein TWF173_004620 [Orbilia oligospora]|nr:hypothetical protein TWF173_004620 [Orbilia oligospora]
MISAHSKDWAHRLHSQNSWICSEKHENNSAYVFSTEDEYLCHIFIHHGHNQSQDSKPVMEGIEITKQSRGAGLHLVSSCPLCLFPLNGDLNSHHSGDEPDNPEVPPGEKKRLGPHRKSEKRVKLSSDAEVVTSWEMGSHIAEHLHHLMIVSLELISAIDGGPYDEDGTQSLTSLSGSRKSAPSHDQLTDRLRDLPSEFQGPIDWSDIGEALSATEAVSVSPKSGEGRTPESPDHFSTDIDFEKTINAIIELSAKLETGWIDDIKPGTEMFDVKSQVEELVAIVKQIQRRLTDQREPVTPPLTSNPLKQAIFDFYVQLELICEAVDSTKEHTRLSRRTGGLNWSSATKTVKDMVSGLEKCRSAISVALQFETRRITSDIGSSKEANTMPSANFTNNINEASYDDERRKILDWITPIDDRSRHNDTFNRCQQGTGEWLLNSTEYQNWLNTAKEVLFCPGPPGAGKTIMSSIVINHLIGQYSYNPAVGVAYIYFNYKVNARITVDEILSNLLKQLARTRDPLSSCVKDLYNRCKGTRPPRAEIVKALGAVVASYSRVFIVVDALDEYERRSEFLGRLFEIHKNYALNIFATSRNIPAIRDNFERQEISLMELEIRASEADIIKYLEGQILHSGGNIVRKNKTIVIDKISKLAHGLFLLAHLCFETIKTSRSLKKLNEALEGFTARVRSSASPYESTYQAIMESIQGYGDIVLTETAFQVLSWIICASRPLTKAELQYAIAVEHPDEASEIDMANLSDVDDLVSYCRGLVTIDEQSKIIRPVHYTVQEYFEWTRMIWFPNSHSDIAKICVIYLSHDTFKFGPCSTYEELEQRLQSNALYEYAATNWGYHIRKSTNDVEDPREVSTNSGVDWFTRPVDMIRLVIDLLSREDIRLACLQAMFTRGRYTQFVDRQSIDRVTGLHVAAHCGLTLVAKVMLAGDGVDLELADNIGRTALLFAAKEGYEDIVRVLIDSGANPEAKNSSGEAAISLAVGNGHESIVQMLIGIGVNLEVKDHRGQTPLFIAARNGSDSIFRRLMESKSDINAVNPEGQTALMAAVERGYETIAELLIKSGASVEDKDKKGQTALMVAAGRCGKDVVELLIKSGASVEDKDEDGETALWEALRYGEGGVLRMLMNRGADLKVKNRLGKTLLSQLDDDQDSDDVRYLIEALINWEDEDNYREIMLTSARYGYEDTIRLLIEKGVGLTAFDGKDGQQLLWNAVMGGYASIVGLLVDQGVDPDQNKIFEGTPLIYAIRQGQEGVARALLERADPNAPNDDGRTPLQVAIEKENKGMIRILAEKGATLDAKSLFMAFKSRNRDTIKFLMENGVDLQTRDIKGRTALSAGIIGDRYYDQDTLELLLEEGADLESRDNKGRTPLLLVVNCCTKSWSNRKAGTLKIEFFIRKKANLEARDIYGRTPLSIAADKGDKGLVRLLMGYGANLESMDNRLQTPLSIAAENGHEDVVRFLVEEGANLETIDEEGKTPLQHAIANEHEDIIRILTARKIRLDY